MSMNMDSRKEQERQRNDRMQHGPVISEKGIADMSGDMQLEPRPDYPHKDRNQHPVDPKIASAFVHFHFDFSLLQSNRLSASGTMDKPGQLLDYSRY